MNAAAFVRGAAHVEINEVAPRDGLQIEPLVVPTEAKLGFVDALSACGFARIEATSFTSARAIPALADAEAVMHRMQRVPACATPRWCPTCAGSARCRVRPTS